MRQIAVSKIIDKATKFIELCSTVCEFRTKKKTSPIKRFAMPRKYLDGLRVVHNLATKLFALAARLQQFLSLMIQDPQLLLVTD